MDLMNSQRKSHIHLQFAQAHVYAKNYKRATQLVYEKLSQ
jgi:hypothetical protein